jgi:hypothetical protein
VSEKNAVKPWLVDEWCIPEAGGEFVWHMEDVLDVYKRPYDPKYPVVGIDEKLVPLASDVREPIPPTPWTPSTPSTPCRPPEPEGAAEAAEAAEGRGKPGRPGRRDYEYKREGTANVFCAFEPLANWRQLEVTERRTMVDFAHFVRGLVDGRYRDAEKVVLVMDNLNTHTPGSLYEAFPPGEAKRIADKLEIHYTPKHGSWLNVAEIELSVLGRRLPDRVPDRPSLAAHAAAIAAERNAAGCTCDWQFTSPDARIKLKRL